jgi:hypothetical protein
LYCMERRKVLKNWHYVRHQFKVRTDILLLPYCFSVKFSCIWQNSLIIKPHLSSLHSLTAALNLEWTMLLWHIQSACNLT